MSEQLNLLASQLEGELYQDDITRTLYATDASAYVTGIVLPVDGGLLTT